jgi:hypothetical protein
MHQEEAGLGQYSLGDRWERADFETGLPDYSMTVQRQVSPAKDLIEQFNDARTPVDSMGNKGKR